DDLFPQVAHSPGEPLLTLDQVAGDPLPREVSLEVRRGEILGVAGLVGAGRTELLRVIAGLAPSTGGEIRLAGQPLAGTPGQRIRRGIALLSEDRKQEGLTQSLSIADNAVLSRLTPYCPGGWLRRRKRDQAVEQLIRKLQIKTAGPAEPVATLSGGNQQKVA